MFAQGKPLERDTLVKKGTIFCEVFAEGKPPERHSQVLSIPFLAYLMFSIPA